MLQLAGRSWPGLASANWSLSGPSPMGRPSSGPCSPARPFSNLPLAAWPADLAGLSRPPDSAEPARPGTGFSAAAVSAVVRARTSALLVPARVA